MESSAWLAFQSVSFSFRERGLARKQKKRKQEEEEKRWEATTKKKKKKKMEGLEKGGSKGCPFAWRNLSTVELVNGPIDGITIKILWFERQKVMRRGQPNELTDHWGYFNVWLLPCHILIDLLMRFLGFLVFLCRLVFTCVWVSCIVFWRLLCGREIFLWNGP